MKACVVLLTLMACDDPSFLVHVNRGVRGPDVIVVPCQGCSPQSVFGANDPNAAERAIGFFVHTVPETLDMQWSVGDRCDQFSVTYAGTHFELGLDVSSVAAPVISSCPSCSAVSPCSASQGGGAGGGSGAGGSTGTGGGITSPIAWTALPVPSLVTDVTAVQALSDNEIWATGTLSTGGSAVLYVDDAGTWVAFNTMSADPLTDLALIPGTPRIAAVEATKVYECDRSTVSCRSATDWHSAPADSQSTLNKLCTDGTRFYATGAAQGSGALFAKQSGTYTLVETAPGPRLEGCTVVADGGVVAGGLGAVVWYWPDGTKQQSGVLPGTLPSTTWVAAHSAAGRTFFAGDDRSIVELLPDAGFSLSFNPPAKAPLHSLTGLEPDALVAAGVESTSNGTLFFNGSAWATGPSILANLSVNGMSTLDDHTYWAVGRLTLSDGGTAGAIVRGAR